MSDDALEGYFAALAERAGTPALRADEAADVLDLARVVAHSSERRFAPLASYAAGLAIGASARDADPSDRAARVREVIQAARGLAGRADA